MTKLLDGKLLSNLIKDEVAEQVNNIKEKYGKEVCLAVVLVGENPASKIYVRNKEKSCEKVGIKSLCIRLPEETTEEELIKKVEELNKDSNVNGILVQLPLPRHINKDNVICHINPDKDVDGLTKENVSRLVLGEDGIVPCTPLGVKEILEHYGYKIEGANICIIGRSMLVGKPLSLLLTNANATVTLCHSKTKEIGKITKKADIIVTCLGKPYFLTKDMVKRDSVVIDVGINKVEDKTVGDADYPNLFGYVKAITPVPGGCGPMTVAELLRNTIKCFVKQNND